MSALCVVHVAITCIGFAPHVSHCHAGAYSDCDRQPLCSLGLEVTLVSSARCSFADGSEVFGASAIRPSDAPYAGTFRSPHCLEHIVHFSWPILSHL